MSYEFNDKSFLELIEQGRLDDALDLTIEEHSADIAQALEQVESTEIVLEVLKKMNLSDQARVFSYFSLEFEKELAELLTPREVSQLMNLMSHDDRADLLNELDEDVQDQVLFHMARSEREDLRRLASFPEESAGSIMTTDYAVLPAQLTARQALDKLRREAANHETINRSYVIDEQRHLLGSVRLQDLILAKPYTPVHEIMLENTHAVRVDDDQEHVANQIAKYDILAVPVVDHEGRVVGIVTHDDAIDVFKEEATEDFHKTATIGKIEGSIRELGIRILYQKRVVWLVLLVFGNIFSGAGIAYFEDLISKYVALVFFLPLLVDSGGNAGSQASTLMIRALATGDLELKDWGRMLFKEIFVAFCLGITMAVAVSGIGWFRGGPEVAFVVACTMVLVVLTGSLIGMSLPFLLNHLKLDPATASAPLITTMADALGVLIYFTVATQILGHFAK